MSNDISNFSISPAINNRAQYNACGVGATDTLSQFNLGMYTSGELKTAGFSLQGANGLNINLNPVKTTRLWINELSSEVSFKVRSDEILTLESLTDDIQILGTMTLNNPSIVRKTTISAGSNRIEDTSNGPFGDPIYTEITPNSIYFQNGNATNQTASMNVSNINLTNTDTGFYTDINVDSIIIQESTGAQINSITNIGISLQDSNLGFYNNIDSSSITSTNWSIDTTGSGIFNTLTVNSIAIITTLSLTGTTLNIPLGAYAIDKSYAITINNNVTVLNPTNGINGGVYKLWLTVGATSRTFTKACGVINNLGGDTLMAANSIWLIEIYRRSVSTYRAIFTNFT